MPRLTLNFLVLLMRPAFPLSHIPGM
jgi:hypothetical protein